MKTISIKIDPLGKPTIEASGFTGEACLSATKPLEDALSGGVPVERVEKAELYETEGSYLQA